MRINKYLKDKGLSTRRGADELIEQGSVFVNGKLAKIGQEVNHRDTIEIKNKKGVKEEKLYYIAYSKAMGVLTNKDTKHDKDILTVTNFKDENNKEIKVFPVGRLDKESYGLILITNDGRITDKLLSPRFKHEKEYIVTVDKPFNDFFLQRMENGIRMDGSITKKAKTERESANSFKIILTEGKKRQIRRMCEALHHNVVDLYRTRIMNVEIGKLKPGEYRHLKEDEKKELLKLLYITPKDSLIKAISKSKVTAVKPKPNTNQNATKEIKTENKRSSSKTTTKSPRRNK